MKVNSEFLEELIRWKGVYKKTRGPLMESSSGVSQLLLNTNHILIKIEISGGSNHGIRGDKLSPTPSPRPVSPRTRMSQDERHKHIKTLFDEFHTKSGFTGIRSWFIEHSTKGKSLSESQFIVFLRQLTDFRDWEILEIYDILGMHH